MSIIKRTVGGNETTATITAKLGPTNNTNGGYPVINNFGQISALVLPKLNLGWFTNEGTLPGNYTDTTITAAVETIVGYTFQTTNSYHNAYFSMTGVAGVFDRKIKPWLDITIPKNVNFFFECRGAVVGGVAQLADVKNGTRDGGAVGDIYGTNLTGLLNEIQAYFTANPNKIGKAEIRICPMHEFQLPDYETGFAYNRVDSNDWSSAANNPALGVNNPADYLPAFARLSAIIKAHSAYTNELVKIVPIANSTFSPRYKIADYIPPRNQYDYYGIDVYDRYQATAGASFYSVNLETILNRQQNQILEQITDFTDAPIIITESGSSSDTNKYSKVERYKRAFDFFLYHPRVQEWTYFGPTSSEWVLSNSQLAKLKSLFYKLKNRLTDKQVKKAINVKSNLITTDLTVLGNWTAAGANVGTLTMSTTTTPAGVGTDESDKASSTLIVPLTAAGTNPLLNHVYVTIPASSFDLNTPHTLTFQAYTDVADSAGDVFGYFSVINSTDVYSNLRGNFWKKLNKEATTIEVGLINGLWTGTTRLVFAFGHNSQTSGNIYITTNTIKLEKGEVATPLIASSANNLTTNTAQTVTGKKTFGTSTSGATLALSGGNAPTTLVAGDVWNDQNDISLETQIGGMRSKIVTNPRQLGFVTRATVANTTTQTALYTLPLPANTITTEKHIRLEIDGRYSTVMTPTLTLDLFMGTVQLTTLSIVMPLGVTDQFYSIRATLQHNGSAGISQPISVGGTVEVFSTMAASIRYPFWTNGSINIDTTVANSLQIRATWSAASTSNTIQARVSTELIS